MVLITDFFYIYTKGKKIVVRALLLKKLAVYSAVVLIKSACTKTLTAAEL